MPSSSQTRRKSRGSSSRGRSKSRSRSQSRSRSRSRSRGRTTQRKSVKSMVVKTETVTRSRSPGRKEKAATPPRSTPIRQSARLAKKSEEYIETEKTKTTFEEVKKEITESNSIHPTKFTYQFGGPVGAAIFTILMPALLFAINLICNKKSFELRIPTLPVWSALFSYQSLLFFLGWVAYLTVLSRIPVGKKVKFAVGDGQKHGVYYCNSMFGLVLTTAVAVGLVYEGYSVNFVIKNFIKLMVSSTLFSFVVSALLYIKALYGKASARNINGNTGYLTYDFFVGAEVNPVFASLHIKLFLMRIATMTWAAINAVYVYDAFMKGTISNNLVIVAVMQTLYLMDFFYFEAGVFNTMTVSHEGTGFITTFASCTLVPFLYCVQTRYLYYFPQSSNYFVCAACVLLFAFGYLVYRGSNSQKEKFRNDPHNPIFAGLETIPTPSGKRLLAAGWWGLVRHPNYLGDMIIALAWTLPCGFSLTVPWLYMVMLLLLMADRAAGDNTLCNNKYGPAWTRYCQRVPYMIIPKIY